MDPGCAGLALPRARADLAVVVHGLFYGNITILLVLLVALAWRYRDRARIAGLALGAAIAAKLFVWPLVVWLLLTRRYRAAAWASGRRVILVISPGRCRLRRARDIRRCSRRRTCTQSAASRVRPSRARFGASVTSPSRRGVLGAPRLLAVAGGSRAGGRRPAGIHGVVRVRPRVADRLAELRGAPVRPDRDHLAEARAGLVLRLRDLGRRRDMPKTDRLDPCGPARDVPVMAWAGVTAIRVPWYAIGIFVVLTVGAATVPSLRGDTGRSRKRSTAVPDA